MTTSASALKGADDAHDGAEESDEGCDGAGRGDGTEAAAEGGAEVFELACQRASGELRGGELARAGRLEGREPGSEELGKPGAIVCTRQSEGLVEATRRQLGTNLCGEGCCPPPLRPEEPEPLSEDAERCHREGRQQEDDRLGDRAHCGPDMYERELHGHCLRLKGKRRFLNTAMLLPL